MLSGGTGEKLVVGGSGEIAYLFVTPKLSGESLWEEALGAEAEAEAAWKAEELSDLGVNGRTKRRQFFDEGTSKLLLDPRGVVAHDVLVAQSREGYHFSASTLEGLRTLWIHSGSDGRGEKRNRNRMSLMA